VARGACRRDASAHRARARSLGFGVVVEARPTFDDVVACIQSIEP
jgi:hypothetical protein